MNLFRGRVFMNFLYGIINIKSKTFHSFIIEFRTESEMLYLFWLKCNNFDHILTQNTIFIGTLHLSIICFSWKFMELLFWSWKISFVNLKVWDEHFKVLSTLNFKWIIWFIWTSSMNWDSPTVTCNTWSPFICFILII